MRGKAKPKKDRKTGADYLDAAWNQLGTAHQSLMVAGLKYYGEIETDTISGIIRDLAKIEQRVAKI